MSELKPCPFCGGEARIYMNDSDLDNILYYCMCTNDRGCNVLPITLDHYNEAEAAAAWNTRYVETCQWEYPQGVNGWVGYAVCSSCGERFDECVTDTAHYCPCCGRKVEG